MVGQRYEIFFNMSDLLCNHRNGDMLCDMVVWKGFPRICLSEYLVLTAVLMKYFCFSLLLKSLYNIIEQCLIITKYCSHYFCTKLYIYESYLVFYLIGTEIYALILQ